ncbi:hypothetical protein [Patulibacter americanus]|uniref:hypothetical protein n=1 Tax=Patulibacter americanus TaxID=588672 RepID=UPI0003B61999|nr:hypothetical protein [Patulibacter americanus]
MSRLPQLERLLVEEAARQDRAARRARRGSTRLFLAVVLAILAGGSAAFAATQLLPEGRAVPAPKQRPGAYVHRYTGPDRVLSLRAADPDGGLPWGLRFTRTRPTGGMGCTQVGRTQDGRIGVVGRDGAFGDDGRFHALPKALVQGCGGLDARGAPSLQASGEATASGLRGWSEQTGGCVPAGTRTPAGVPGCAPSSARTVVYGFAGPGARSVTLHERGGPSRTIDTGRKVYGAYLFVLRGAPGAHRRVRLTARFADGRTCSQGGSGRPRGPTRACLAAAGFDFRRRKGARRTPTQRALARMAARRARARKQPLDVSIRGLDPPGFRFVPPLRGLHDYQVMIACTRKTAAAFVTARLRGGRPATVRVPGTLGKDCRLPAKGTVTQAGTGRAIGTFVLPAP